MGQKTNPVGLRLGIIKSWNSKWFATRNFGDLLNEDLVIRRYTEKRLENAGIAQTEIIRTPQKVTLDIHTARPGIVIGRKGAEVDKLKEELQLLTKKDMTVNIIEVKKPELSAPLVAQSIAKQLEGRVSYRRAMKKAINQAMKSGAEGVKICCGGRLAGAEIARTEHYMEGKVPLHTLRADIDYATATAFTTYGCIGVKVWLCKGEVLGPDAGLRAELPTFERRREERRTPERETSGRPGSDRKRKRFGKNRSSSETRPKEQG